MYYSRRMGKPAGPCTADTAENLFVTRVVLVDDHPLFVQALRAAVERAGIDVVGTASRGDELMDLMDSVETDAVLLDLAMPGLDGYECLTQLRERHPKVRVI